MNEEKTYEAGIKFGNECFVKFNYLSEGKVIEVVVIDPEKTYTGSVILDEQE